VQFPFPPFLRRNFFFFFTCGGGWSCLFGLWSFPQVFFFFPPFTDFPPFRSGCASNATSFFSVTLHLFFHPFGLPYPVIFSEIGIMFFSTIIIAAVVALKDSVISGRLTYVLFVTVISPAGRDFQPDITPARPGSDSYIHFLIRFSFVPNACFYLVYVTSAFLY